MPKIPWRGTLRYLGRWKRSLWHGGLTRDAVITFPDGLQRRVEALILPAAGTPYFRYAPQGDKFTYRVHYAHSFLSERPVTGSAKTLQAAKLRASKAMEELTKDFE